MGEELGPERTPTSMRTFYLERYEDVTGTSGTGLVAEGVAFKDGTCVMRWVTNPGSVAFYNSVSDVVKIHGHKGRTKLWWHSGYRMDMPGSQL